MLLRNMVTRGATIRSRAHVDALKEVVQKSAQQYTIQETGLTPLVIPVVNVVGASGKTNRVARPVAEVHS